MVNVSLQGISGVITKRGNDREHDVAVILGIDRGELFQTVDGLLAEEDNLEEEIKDGTVLVLFFLLLLLRSLEAACAAAKARSTAGV